MPTTSNIVSKVASVDAIISEIQDFLEVRTPEAWISHALGDLATLLIDHANCEYKAAATGMSLITRYRNKPRLQRLMARLVREEMLHYEQVLVLMDQMGVDYRPLTASRYAKTLRDAVRSDEDGRLVDVLIVGAVVEARSCERFAALWPRLPTRLGKFYKSLLRSEGRHYQDYLSLAYNFADKSDVEQRLIHFLKIDQTLIETTDDEFRFHSGVPG
ncbi:MAG TPA: tRNA-(ms[2]io[6]A)-hydroxylase [Gammaproteobacteria bacterium]|nr:tRNA-(ms[2]io[6]A)-hydroxylase [Gammaproteobacteria bacterium]